MTVKALIEDSQTGASAKVSPYGELIVSSLAYDTASVQSMTATATAYSFAPPVAGKKVVITGIIFNADKNVSATTEADIVLYCSSVGPDSLTSAGSILEVGLIKNQYLSVTPLNIITDEGMWINATTSDATIHATVLYHYVEEL